MALNQIIDDVVAGDDYDVLRTVPGLPATMSKAWLTVKANATDADPGVFQLAITGTQTSMGQITDTGVSGTGALTFAITAAQSVLLTPETWYAYDVKVKLSTGRVGRVEVGRIRVHQGVTQATV